MSPKSRKFRRSIAAYSIVRNRLIQGSPSSRQNPLFVLSLSATRLHLELGGRRNHRPHLPPTQQNCKNARQRICLSLDIPCVLREWKGRRSGRCNQGRIQRGSREGFGRRYPRVEKKLPSEVLSIHIQRIGGGGRGHLKGISLL